MLEGCESDTLWYDVVAYRRRSSVSLQRFDGVIGPVFMQRNVRSVRNATDVRQLTQRPLFCGVFAVATAAASAAFVACFWVETALEAAVA